MQTTGYVQINGQKVLVLVRQGKHFRSLKIRKSGKEGSFFTDESDFLSLPENQNLANDLINGRVIKV